MILPHLPPSRKVAERVEIRYGLPRAKGDHAVFCTSDGVKSYVRPGHGRDEPLKAEGTRSRRDGRRALIVALASTLLASCATSDSDVPFGFAMSDIAPVATQSQTHDATNSPGDLSTNETVSAFVIEEGDPALPDAVVAAPVMRPGPDAETLVAAETATTLQAQAMALQAQTASLQPAPDLLPQAQQQPSAAETPPAEIQVAPTQALQASPAGMAAAPEAAAPVRKRNFLSAFFSPSQPAAARPKAARPLIDPTANRPSTASATPPTQPLVQIAAAGDAARPLVARSATADASSLPGVRPDSLFEITRRSGIDDDSDIDLHEDEPSYQVASAAGMARLAPNGLLRQTDNVDVACLKPSLVRVLRTVEKHYGRKVVVTSGYRSPDRNRRARGARNSLHMYCAAADVQVEGVSKWDLAQYVRSMPGRGGVGTYCHTESVHIDVGPERDWNWRCRRRK